MSEPVVERLPHSNRTCPVCSDSIRRAPYRTKDRRGHTIEHPEPKPASTR